MANSKLTALTALAEAPNDADLVYVVDTSDTTDGASGTGKKITAANLKSGLATTNHDHNSTYVALSGNQTIADVKTFSSIPLIPTTTPTLDGQATSKAYVDGAIIAAGGYTDEQAQDAVGSILTDSSSIDFTYDDGNGTITAIVKNGVYKAVGADETANVTAASTLAAGKVQIALGAEVTAGTNDTLAISPKALKDANIVAVTLPVKATGAETDTGTDDAKFLTPKAIEDSSYIKSTGNAATATALATARAINGVNFDGTAAITINDLFYATPASDHTATGIKITRTAGESLAIGDVCYVKSDGKLWKANASAATTMPGCMVALGTINADAAGSFLVRGIVRDDTWTWTVGGLVYVSATTAGVLTQTAPTGTGKQIQVVGVALDADNLLFMPNMILLELA